MSDTLRLRKNADFKKIYAKGKSLANRQLVLFYMKNNQGYNRVGFIASKKVGNSVKRNKARRLMKESFRIYDQQLEKGYDLILIARVNINHATYQEVEKAMAHILKKSKILK